MAHNQTQSEMGGIYASRLAGNWTGAGLMETLKTISPELWANGTLYIDGDYILGRAYDGVIVEIGTLGQLNRAICYLSDRPTPDKW